MSQERMAIREHLKKEPLVFDGGMGTYYAQKTHTRGKGVELANIDTPIVVEEIHTEYLRAGAQGNQDEYLCGKSYRLPRRHGDR